MRSLESTLMPWPKQLDRFPLFAIERVSAGDSTVRCEGLVVNSAPLPAPGRYVWLAKELPDAIYGDVISADASSGRLVLDLQADPCLSVGSSFPLLDGYHDAYLVWLVLDQSRGWTRTRFLPRDAVETAGTDGFRRLEPTNGRGGNTARFYPPQDDQSSPASAGVVPSGWDHEHCKICSATISPHAEPEGYVDDEQNWFCCRCFDTYVARHDLGFMR